VELGADFVLAPVDVDERSLPGEYPVAYARRVAAAKARAAYASSPGSWVLAADTIVEVDGFILGKPTGIDGARAMLWRLSGRAHRVLTAVALLSPGGSLDLDEVVTSQVRFRRLAHAEIEAYLATGEPFDKAGAYAVQGLGGRFVEAVEGCFSSVVGLPVELVSAALRARGLLP
jgi:septum formation protein